MADAFSFMTSTFKNINDFQTKNCDDKSNFYVENDEIISYSDNDGNGNGYPQTNYGDFTTFEELILSDANGNNNADFEEIMNYEDLTFDDGQSNGYKYDEAFSNYVASDSSGNGYQFGDDEDNAGFDIES